MGATAVIGLGGSVPDAARAVNFLFSAEGGRCSFQFSSASNPESEKAVRAYSLLDRLHETCHAASLLWVKRAGLASWTMELQDAYVSPPRN